MNRPTGAILIIVAVLLGLLGAPWMPRAAAMAIERVTGAGGVEAWLVEDHSIPVVTLRFAMPGGAALDPPGKEGIAAMAASLLDEGAGAYDSIAYHRRLDDLAGELSFTAGQDEFGGSLRMLKRNWRRPPSCCVWRSPSRISPPMRSSGSAARRSRCWRARRTTRVVGQPAVDARRLRGPSLRQG